MSNQPNILKRLIVDGKKAGKLYASKISEIIANSNISSDDLEIFLEQCTQNNVQIIDDENEENDLYFSGEESDYNDAIPNIVQMYLNEIGKIPLLSPEEEKSLAKTVKEGSPEEAKKAKEKLIKSNLRLVVAFAKKSAAYKNESLLDVIQNGNLGLIKAVDKFDYSKGFRFSTYANWWIRQAISKYAIGNTISMPASIKRRIKSINIAKNTLMLSNGKEPSVEDIAEKLNLTVEEVTETLLYSQEIISLDSPIGEDDSTSTLMSVIPDDKGNFSDNLDTQLMVKEILSNAYYYLTPREFDTIKKRFGFYDGHLYSLEEISKSYHVTRERVRQIERDALRKIRTRCIKK